MNNEILNNLHNLNDLEEKYQYYMTNLDNIYAWACEQYNTEMPTAEQLESICEYRLNYSDYEYITDQISSKMQKLIKKLPELEYNGDCYRIKESEVQ